MLEGTGLLIAAGNSITRYKRKQLRKCNDYNQPMYIDNKRSARSQVIENWYFINCVSTKLIRFLFGCFLLSKLPSLVGVNAETYVLRVEKIGQMFYCHILLYKHYHL